MENEDTKILPTRVHECFSNESEETINNIHFGNKAYNWLAECKLIKPAYNHEVFGTINKLHEDTLWRYAKLMGIFSQDREEYPDNNEFMHELMRIVEEKLQYDLDIEAELEAVRKMNSPNK